jgi:hypothetical protein
VAHTVNRVPWTAGASHHASRRLVAPKPRGAVPAGLAGGRLIPGRACVGSVVIELRVLRSAVE